MPPVSFARLNAVSMPSFIWLPSSLAAPVNGAEMPNRISLSVTPRMGEVSSFVAPTDATIAGAALVGCGAAEAIGRSAVAGAALVGCAAIEAIGRPGGEELTCVGIFGTSSLEVVSLELVPNPKALRHVVPSTKYTPIAAPNTTAKKMETSHQGFQGDRRKCITSGSSDRRRNVASLSEEGRKPNLGISLSAPGLPCWLALRTDLGYSPSAVGLPCLAGRIDLGAYSKCLSPGFSKLLSAGSLMNATYRMVDYAYF